MTRSDASKVPAIEITNLDFEYERGVPTLSDVTLSIPPGNRVAFVGRSGSGKSTLLKLLNRLDHGYRGTIELHGADLTTIQHIELSTRMTLVSQEPFILSTSIAENIRFGVDAADAEVEHAARRASAHEFITRTTAGYDTIVGANGSTLSGGQKQRICLARALVRSPEILLLDEPTSRLDNESQKEVQDAIATLTDTTIIEVAHRLGTVRDADTIYVLDAGTIVQSGSFYELSRTTGLFRRLLDAERHSD